MRIFTRVIISHFNIIVADTGPSIPVQYQTRIFEQVQQVVSPKGGSGLGFAIAK